MFKKECELHGNLVKIRIERDKENYGNLDSML